MFTQEGHYTFRAVASYGEGCLGTREIVWSVHVMPGVDSTKTDLIINILENLANGKQRIRITVTPKDIYGNRIGPGRVELIHLAPVSGTTLTGALKDKNDGSYEALAEYDPLSGNAPGVIITQPDREPVVLQEKNTPDTSTKLPFWLIWLLLLIILILLLLLWLS